MRQSRGARLARGASAASIATFAALISHVAADGAMPAAAGIIVPGVLSLMVCTLLAGRRLSLSRLSIAVLLSQGLFHALFVLGASSAHIGSPGHDHAAMVAAMPTPVPGVVAWPDPAMWAGHAVAALITIAALYRGERALTALARNAHDLVAWLRRRIRLLTGYRPPVLPRPLIRVAVWVDASPVHVSLRQLPRRGPPLIVTV